MGHMDCRVKGKESSLQIDVDNLRKENVEMQRKVMFQLSMLFLSISCSPTGTRDG